MHTIIFKILLLIYSSPFVANAHPLSPEDHCLKIIENQWNIKPSAPHNIYTTVYLNHLRQCNLPIDHRFSLYKSLLTQLFIAFPSPSSMDAMSKVVNDILDQIPNPDLDSLSEISQGPWETLFEREKADENIVFNIPSFINYDFETPLSFSQNIQYLQDAPQHPLHVVQLTKTFSSQFSICTNTKNFQHLLKPLHDFLQNFIFKFTQSIDNSQFYSFQQLYNIYQSLHQQQTQAPGHLQFISWLQFPLPFIEFLESIDWTTPPFLNSYAWLKPLLTLLTLYKHVREKMQEYCIPYQPFEKNNLEEYHYIIQFLEDYQPSEKTRRDELLKVIRANLKNISDSFFFRSTTQPDKKRIYIYFLRLHSDPE